MMAQRGASGSTERRFEGLLGLITLLAVAWRLVYVSLEPRFQAFSDENWYVTEAHRLFGPRPFTAVFQSQFPSAQHGPLTSIVLSPVAWAFPSSSSGLRFVMAVIGGAVIVVMGLLGRQLGGERVGILCAGLAAANPGFWVRDGLATSETISTLLVALLLLVALHFLESPRLVVATALGALLGLAALARGELLLLAPLFVIPVLVIGLRRQRLSAGRKIAAVALCAVALLAVLSPWVGFNAGRFQRTVLLTNNLGTTLAGADCKAGFYYGPLIGYDALLCNAAADKIAGATSNDEAVRSDIERSIALHYVGEHLSRVPLVLVMREAWLLGLYRPGWVVSLSVAIGQPTWATWSQAVGLWILIPLAVVGALLRRRKELAVWPELLFVLNTLLVAAIFVGHWRYRITAEVAMLPLAAIAIDESWQRWSDRVAAPPADDILPSSSTTS